MVKNDGKWFSKIFKNFKFSDSTESGSRLHWSPDSKKNVVAPPKWSSANSDKFIA